MHHHRRLAALIAIAVLISACSGGVSEDEYDAAIAAERHANEQLVAAEADNERLVGQLTERTSELDTSMSDLEEAAGRLEAMSADVEAGRAELEVAQQAIDDLRALSVLTKADGTTLGSVQAAGTVRCGISGSLLGFSAIDERGEASGFDVDFCRAIAAAAVGDADAVVFVPLTAGERFAALQTGAIDVLVRNTTHTLARSADEGLDFGPTVLHDGQQFIGPSAAYAGPGVEALDGARVCAVSGSPHEARVDEIAASLDVSVSIVAVANGAEAMVRLADGECDVVTGDGSALAASSARAVEEKLFGRGDLTIFPRIPYSNEPLAPAVLQGDTLWRDLVDWTVYTTIIADEKGITSANIDSIAWDDAAMRLFGDTGESATLMGLAPDAFYQVIKQVGSYGEIYDRNLTPLGLDRTDSLNRLWNEGGLLRAPRV